MTTPLLILGLLVATLVFWAVGAYNRLVRLRSEVARAFAALDAVLSVHPVLIQAWLPEVLTPELLPDGSPSPWNRLSSAGEQYARSLANARARPLDPEALSALCAAQRVLDDVWHSVEQGRGDEGPDNGLPDSVKLQFARLAEQQRGPREAFDASASAYNSAVRQFPAVVLARIWGFRPAGLIRSQSPG